VMVEPEKQTFEDELMIEEGVLILQFCQEEAMIEQKEMETEVVQ
jgi:hypothetical protein